MSDVLSLTAEIREELGTGASRGLRKRGIVPATIYGAGKKPLSIAIEEKEITKYYRKPQFISQVIQFEIGEKKHKVLPKLIDLHPITDVVYHASFVFLENKMQKMQVPVVYSNRENCIGVKRGGYFNVVRRTLTILCPVDHLPRKLEIDTTKLHIGTSIKASQVALPKGAKLLEKSDLVIASIIGRKSKEVDEEKETTELSAKSTK